MLSHADFFSLYFVLSRPCTAGLCSSSEVSKNLKLTYARAVNLMHPFLSFLNSSSDNMAHTLVQTPGERERLSFINNINCFDVLSHKTYLKRLENSGRGKGVKLLHSSARLGNFFVQGI